MLHNRGMRTFHNETELVSLASVVQFFGSHHKSLTKKKLKKTNDNENASSQNLISKSIRKMKKDVSKF